MITTKVGPPSHGELFVDSMVVNTPNDVFHIYEVPTNYFIKVGDHLYFFDGKDLYNYDVYEDDGKQFLQINGIV